MKSALRVCSNCGAEIPADAQQRVCPACLLEIGLGLLTVEPVSGVVDSGRDHGARVANGKKAISPVKTLGEFGDYELLEEVGRGGQGAVYRARQKSLNRTVALKVIGLGQWATEAHLKRFRREAEAAASLAHPGIVPIHEVGERDGYCYFSMNFVEGGQLDEVVRRTPISIRQAAELIAKVARIVHYAHEHGILHRDIKPGNILLDQKGEPHLTDFGLARLVETESTVTRTREVLGTPSYMAPEQAVGETRKLTSATDVYGLGAVLYQLLTGQPPFAGQTTYETIRLLLDTEPRPPRVLNPKIDRDLSTICLKCLEKDPKRRYSSALALAEDLEHWLKHEPIWAKRRGFVIRAGKWVQRKPAIAALSASLVALAAAIGWNVWKSELVRAAPDKSIAVIPFANLSPDPDNAYFADGIQEEILTRLASVADLKVISRTSTQRYQSKPHNLSQIAKQLGVANIVEGSVQKVADQVRVNVQLVNAQTDFHLWAETYDRQLTDILGVESEIAKAIAESLQAKLTGREEQALAAKPTNNPEAYDAYLHAVAIDDASTLERTSEVVRLYDEAVRLDPQFALAWARLAVARSQLHFNGIDMDKNSGAAVKEAADRAMSLQPELGEAWLAQGVYRYRVLRDFQGALQSYEEALRRLPNSAFVLKQMAHLERRLGKLDVAQKHYQAAAQLDPRDIGILLTLADTFLTIRRYEEARTVVDRALEISPGNEAALAQKAFSLQAEGRLNEAAEILEKAPANSQDELLTFARATQLYDERRFDKAIAYIQQKMPPAFANDPRIMTLLGYCQKFAGHDDEARTTFTHAVAAMKPTPDSVVVVDARQLPCYLAQIYAGLGEKEKALDQARHAIADYDNDALAKPLAEISLATVQAQVGEIDSAISTLSHLLEVPNGEARADLRINPFWDPLRSDPRFQKLCEEKQP
jgi:serine/threonine protein kinase/Tfp pilus assembly protein PilF